MFLLIVAMLNYNEQPDKSFSLENFYQGNVGERDDPKKIYDSMNSGKVDTIASCNRTPTSMKVDELMELPNSRYWIKSGVESFTELPEDIYVTSEDGEKKKYIKPFSDGDKIIAPERVTFLNSNKTSGYSETYMMEFQGSDNFIVVLEDIKSWWCHIGKEEQRVHTETIGYGGAVGAIMSSGYILGEAKANTIVHVYKVIDGRKTEVDAADYFIKLRGEE